MQHPPTSLPKTRRKPLLPDANPFVTGQGNPEFSQVMEKEESDRLEGARKKLIAETDNWRSQLIKKENELQLLKRDLNEL